MVNKEKLWVKSLEFKIQQKKKEWLEFVDRILGMGNVNNIMEIGCYNGGSTASLCQLTKNLITVDILDPPLFGDRGFKFFESNCSYTYIPGNSSLVGDTVKTIIGSQKLDVLFIDGNHTYEGCKKDFEIYEICVKSGGIIAFHDIIDSEYHRKCSCNVSKFWQEIKSKYDSTEIYDSVQYPEWGGIGVLIK